jgi:hypothetical protein
MTCASATVIAENISTSILTIFPQAACNPQPAHCYPEAALGEFKQWLRERYIRGGKFQAYIAGQVQKKQITSEAARKALAAYGATPAIGMG